MIRLFAHAPAAQNEVPASHLLAVIEAYQQDWLTGIVEINLAPATRIVLLLVDGTTLNTYLVTEAACEQISLSRLAELLPAGTVTVRTLTLPLEGVRTAQMLLEWHPPLETITAETVAIQKHLDAWRADAVTNGVHITWPDAEGFVALPGGAVFVSSERVEVDDAGLAAIVAHPVALCTLARYEARTAISQQEQTFPLRTAFVLLVDDLLQRYTELVGHKLANALMFDVNIKAETRGWRIRITGNGVADTHVFKTPDAAAGAYRSLIRDLSDHMAVVIGARLAKAVIRETIGKLDSQTQQTLQSYSMVPSGSVAVGVAI